jgi:uncharacterized protein (TIGR00730 family)
MTKGICVFCGSQFGNHPAYEGAAIRMGELIAKEGWRLVYGGGSVGLMGVVSRAAIAAGGHVTGVIPAFLRYVEAPADEVTDMHIVDTMHTRKQMMFDFSDAFVVLPGGVGTMDELVEMTTWSQLQRHAKPILLVDTLNYFEEYHTLMRTIVDKGFAKPSIYDLYERTASPDTAIERLRVLLG